MNCQFSNKMSIEFKSIEGDLTSLFTELLARGETILVHKIMYFKFDLEELTLLEMSSPRIKTFERLLDLYCTQWEIKIDEIVLNSELENCPDI